MCIGAIAEGEKEICNSRISNCNDDDRKNGSASSVVRARTIQFYAFPVDTTVKHAKEEHVTIGWKPSGGENAGPRMIEEDRMAYKFCMSLMVGIIPDTKNDRRICVVTIYEGCTSCKDKRGRCNEKEVSQG